MAPVNYIKHLQSISSQFEEDNRLSPWHISLYYALFHCWNNNKRQNPVSINRNEVMRLSKIGSVNTYTKALKQLHDWEYIQYEPSNNRWVGSQIYMYRFDNGSDNSTSKRTSKETNNTSEQDVVKEVRPSLKSKKNSKELKGLKEERALSSRRPNPEREVQKDEGKRAYGRFAPPELNELKDFFLQEESSSSEAENFFNYFESNGWLVGGKAKMKNWKAAAKNWIKRSAQFKKPTSQAQSRLHTNNDKNYSIPL